MVEPSPLSAAAVVVTGRVLGGRYHMDDLLARGGMADVWRGTDSLLQRPVAIKVLHPHLAADPTYLERFRSEAIVVARLHHPGIVSVFDTCSDDGTEAIVMELVTGHTLRQELDLAPTMSSERVAATGATVADALAAAHRAGLVHRDVKPSNILMCDDERVLITDFGIAKIRDATDRTQAGTMLGSVKYLSPEQVEGNPVDGRSDVFSLGVVLYEALTGRVPYVADTAAATAVARLHTRPPSPRTVRGDIPPALDLAVMRCLEIDPTARFPTAGDLKAALEATSLRPTADPDATTVEPRPVITTSGVLQPTDATPTAPDVPRRRRRWGTAVVVLALIAAALATVGVVLARADVGRHVAGPADVRPPAATSNAIAITRVTAFDPLGDDKEGDDTLAAVTDLDPSTGWRTEMYDSRAFGRLKEGVGLQVDLERPGALASLELTSPTKGWSAQVYVADQPGTTLADWGNPVAVQDGIDQNVTFDLRGAKGNAVLVWITDLGNGPPRVFTQINAIRISGA